MLLFIVMNERLRRDNTQSVQTTVLKYWQWLPFSTKDYSIVPTSRSMVNYTKRTYQHFIYVFCRCISLFDNVSLLYHLTLLDAVSCLQVPSACLAHTFSLCVRRTKRLHLHWWQTSTQGAKWTKQTNITIRRPSSSASQPTPIVAVSH